MLGIGKKRPVITPKEDVIKAMKEGLDANEFKYNYDPAKSLFITSFMGDDLPIAMNIYIDDMAIHFVCLLDLRAAPENYNTVAWNLNCINKKLVFGAFYLDPDDGMITFEYGFPFLEAKVSPEFLISFIAHFVKIVDEHDGDLKLLAEAATPRDSMYG
jgi:hypothetical protein